MKTPPLKTAPLKTAPRIQRFITSLEEKHALRLQRNQGQLTLSLGEDKELALYSYAPNVCEIRVSYLEKGQWNDEPVVMLFRGTQEWVPLTYCPGGPRSGGPTPKMHRYAWPSEDGREVEVVQRPDQAVLACLCELWAGRLEQEGWLEVAPVS